MCCFSSIISTSLIDQDPVKRDFTAERPNRLRVADLAGLFVYTAFVINACFRMIMGRGGCSGHCGATLRRMFWSRLCNPVPKRMSLCITVDRGVRYLSQVH